MANATQTTRTLNGEVFAEVLVAGIRHLFQRRDYINRINVFPVPDSDTGTNMAFTFKSILDALESQGADSLPALLAAVSDAALDGARGNSGAIMAQYMQGFREASEGLESLNALQLAAACQRGSEQAWTAMAEPVPGTLPTVLEDHAKVLGETAQAGLENLCEVFAKSLVGARESLANTPNQLPVLKHAGVVDAGGQGFVDLLEGINAYLVDGVIDELDADWQTLEDEAPGIDLDVGDHQFCTECVIEGQRLDRQEILQHLQNLDQSSLVVAGSGQRVRVHIHVNSPAEVFLACESFGEITQQKADDMRWQHGLLNQTGRVAVVTDSGADLPPGEVDRLGIHVVPVRLSFGEREYLDGVTLQPAEFYAMLSDSQKTPLTSQPPPKDFRRVFELLDGHGYQVLYLGLSSLLSGTLQAGDSAARRMPAATISVVDSLNASCGQGLLAMIAAEWASADRSLEDIMQGLEALVPVTRVMAMPDELDSAVRGGRVPGWVRRLARLLHVTPVLTAKGGRMSLAGVHRGRGVNPGRFARRVLKAMQAEGTYWVMVAHVDNAEGAREMRKRLLQGHGRVHSCHIAEAGPALGVHLGIGGLIVGFLPDPHTLEPDGD